MSKDLYLIIFIVFAIIVLPIVIADDAPYGDHIWTAKNILAPGANNFLSTISLGFANTEDTDVVQGMFDYTLKGWEVNVCSQHVTEDTSYQPPNGFSGVSTDLTKIYDDVATLTASKTKVNNYDNTTLIEVFWYVQPKNADIEYNIYLLYGSQKMYLEKNRVSDTAQGDTDYIADYYLINYTHAVIEYKNGQQILKTIIVQKD